MSMQVAAGRSGKNEHLSQQPQHPGADVQVAKTSDAVPGVHCDLLNSQDQPTDTQQSTSGVELLNDANSAAAVVMSLPNSTLPNAVPSATTRTGTELHISGSTDYQSTNASSPQLLVAASSQEVSPTIADEDPDFKADIYALEDLPYHIDARERFPLLGKQDNPKRNWFFLWQWRRANMAMNGISDFALHLHEAGIMFPGEDEQILIQIQKASQLNPSDIIIGPEARGSTHYQWLDKLRIIAGPNGDELHTESALVHLWNNKGLTHPDHQDEGHLCIGIIEPFHLVRQPWDPRLHGPHSPVTIYYGGLFHSYATIDLRSCDKVFIPNLKYHLYVASTLPSSLLFKRRFYAKLEEERIPLGLKWAKALIKPADVVALMAKDNDERLRIECIAPVGVSRLSYYGLELPSAEKELRIAELWAMASRQLAQNSSVAATSDTALSTDTSTTATAHGVAVADEPEIPEKRTMLTEGVAALGNNQDGGHDVPQQSLETHKTKAEVPDLNTGEIEDGERKSTPTTETLGFIRHAGPLPDQSTAIKERPTYKRVRSARSLVPESPQLRTGEGVGPRQQDNSDRADRGRPHSLTRRDESTAARRGDRRQDRRGRAPGPRDRRERGREARSPSRRPRDRSPVRADRSASPHRRRDSDRERHRRSAGRQVRDGHRREADERRNAPRYSDNDDRGGFEREGRARDITERARARDRVDGYRRY